MHIHIEGILPKGPYLPCVSMAGRALLAGYHRYMMVLAGWMIKEFVRKIDHYTREFTLFVKWENSPVTYMEYMLFQRQHLYCILHVSDHFEHSKKYYGTLTGVTNMRYMSPQHHICHSREWRMQYMRCHIWIIYGPNICIYNDIKIIHTSELSVAC